MNSRRLLFILILSFAWPCLSQAEYRVFLLKISRGPASQDFRLVQSTLDHLQYRLYYPVAQDEVVTYIDTWRCYGRTDEFKTFCPNPKGQIPADSAGAP